ncbi:hypothetical protein QMZ25_03795 [Stenotrophomonas sp. RS-48]|uniref:hypothetical protein n=1 Tax=Stenotrophomonas TaxID=40323 RepID=UPI00240272E2|nr:MULTISPECIES: hypothetical protein [Stenotrophomonas]MDI9247704.1 hypothetical protein [Stenotrophomonas sp. RS-48]
MKLTVNDYAAVASVLVSAVSALWAWSSARIAKRALALAQAEADQNQEGITAELIRALKWQRNGSSFMSISCSVNNSSKSPTVVNRMELMIHFFDPSGIGNKMLLPSCASSPSGSDFSRLEQPLNIQPRSAVSGWVSFDISQLPEGSKVERHEMVGTTWSGKRFSVNVYQFVREAGDEGGGQ